MFHNAVAFLHTYLNHVLFWTISFIKLLLIISSQVCNHPDLFEERGVMSPLGLPSLKYDTPSTVLNALRDNNQINLDYFNLHLASYESSLSAHSGKLCTILNSNW